MTAVPAGRTSLPAGCASLGDVLRHRAAVTPDRRAYTFLADGERDERPITYAELDARARAIAASLAAHAAPRDRAILLVPTGLDFVAAFLGCMYANVVAVPVPAHFRDPGRLARTLPRLGAIAADAEAAVVIATTDGMAHAELVTAHAPALAALPWIAADAVPAAVDAWSPTPASPDDLAFLQYSSGSTGTPKGVMVSHANLMHNSAAIARAFGHDEAAVGVSWLPAYHDMGLVADVVQPLYAGFPMAFMSPFDFIARPMRWLTAIARHGATTSGAPNFAYALCAARATPAEVAALDLSRWRVAYNCAEPVRAADLDRFAEVFGPAGFRREAFFPYLGMAEATLVVSAGARAAAPVLATDGEGRRHVGCGVSLPDQAIAIVDPTTRTPRPDGAVGEIWVAGPSVARGYWRRPDETAATFQARLPGRARPWLRTGDLGFLRGGELFVTGRLKDLIIVQGQNHYPQDLEATAEAAHPALRPGCSAAFAAAGEEGEAVVLVAEVVDPESLDPVAVSAAVRGALLEAHQLIAHDVVLLPPGSLPKTSSGKVQRQSCAKLWTEGTLPPRPEGRGSAQRWGGGLPETPGASPTPGLSATPACSARPRTHPCGGEVAALFAELLGLPAVGVDDDFLRLGGHSLLGTRLAAAIQARHGVTMPLAWLFEAPTPARLAARLARATADALPALTPAPTTGPWTPSAAEARMAFLDALEPGTSLYVVAAVLDVAGPLDEAALEAALGDLVARHEALRTRFLPAPGGALEAHTSPTAAFTLERAPDADPRDLTFDLAHAPLLRARLASLASLGPATHRLAIALHHVVADGWTMGVLARELAAAYAARRKDEAPAFPPLPATMADHARWQRAWLAGGAREAQRAFWRVHLDGAPVELRLPHDRPRPPQASFRGAHIPFHLDAAHAADLATYARAAGVTPFMVLLAAFQVMLQRLSGQADLVVGVPVANRRLAAFEPLVGLFVNTVALRADLAAAPTFRALTAQARDRALAAQAHQDLPFDEVVAALDPPRHAGRHPLFQAMLVVQDAAMGAWALDGTAVTRRDADLGVAKFDLMLELMPEAEGWRGRLEYATDLFEAATAARWAGDFGRLLADALAAPDAPLPALAPWLDLAPPPAAEPAWTEALVPAVLPATEDERRIAALFAEVLADLDLPAIDVHASFFDLGGHSLLAARLAARLRVAFGVDLPLRALFAAPSVAALAQVVRGLARVDDVPALVAAGSPTSAPAGHLPPQGVRGDSPGAESTSPSPLVGEGGPQGRVWGTRGTPGVAPTQDSRLTTQDSAGPLSYTQEGLWFLAQLDPASAAYTHVAAWRLAGPVDHPALADALDHLVATHGALRTRITTHDGHPVAITDPPTPFTLTHDDLSAHPDPAAEARRRAEAMAREGFDLAAAPPLRARLLTLGPADALLVLTVHHGAADGWSMALLTEQLWAAYAALRDGRQPTPSTPLQAADFAAWQRGWLHREALARLLAPWRERLAGAPELLALPTDRPRPATARHRGGVVRFAWDAPLAADIADLARREAATPFMLLLTAFVVLLARHTHQADMCVGVPFANRRQREAECIVGLLANTLVIRAELGGAPTFREALAHVKARVLDAEAHQDVPFEKLVEALNPPRGGSHHPLFQAMFALQEAPRLPPLGPLTVVPAPVDPGTAKFDLSLDFVRDGAGWAGRLDYDADLFDEATIARMAGHLETLVRGALAAPDTPLHALPLLTRAERHDLLDAWNATAVAFPDQTCIHERIAAQAARTPDAIAAEYEGATLTYAALDAAANRLAHHLVARGVGPDVLVGLGVERSLDLMVAILAILKAGGAYVALDPAWPPARVRFMREAAGVRLVLAQAATAELYAADGVEVLRVDAEADAAAWRDAPATAPATGVGLDHLVSIIYTSGSTGKPKGVMNLHRGVVNHLDHRQAAYGMTPADRIMQKTSINFDGSVWELFWPLMVGARVCLAPPAAQKDADYLLAFVRDHGITMIDFVPSMLQEVLRDGKLATCPTLRHYFVGGEALTPAQRAAFFAQVDHAELTHGYGPTETTVSVLYHDCRRDDPRPEVPIGRPNSNIHVRVVGPHGELVPVGVPGELLIGGAGLARGYLGRPELTAERFVPDPFTPERGLLYRSGDLVRWLPDGQVQFLGRVDHQVKLRGFRIELGEIEATLARHPAIEEVVVLAREDAPGDKRLVAYVVARAGEVPAVGALRAHLREELPDHMVPAAFVALDRLPLDPNGKVDRRALPAPERGRDGADVAYVAPETVEQAALAALFAEVLGVERVGIHDGFFDLGGHSLLATRLVARARERLGVEIPLRRVFETPTVAALAESAGAAGSPTSGLAATSPPLGGGEELSGPGELPLTPWGRGPSRLPGGPAHKDSAGAEVGDPTARPHPLSYAQERLWFMDQLEPGRTLYNMPAAYRLTGPLDLPALAAALTALVARHDALRTRFLPGPTQVVDLPAPFPLAVLDLTEHPDPQAEAARLAARDAETPFDLATGPLIRAALLQTAPTEHWLLLNLHHIVSDGWSWRVMARELAALYRGDAALPPLPMRYVDYAQWQREWLEGPAMATQLAYWRERLAGAPPLLPLPTDRPRPAVAGFRGERLEIPLGTTLPAAVAAFARDTDTTPFMVLLAAFQALLARHADVEDLCVGVPIANRRHAELEPLIGFFVNTLVLRADLAGAPTFRAHLAATRAACLDAYAHQDLPFEKLVEALNPKRDPAWHPLFQTLFVLQDEGPEAFTLDGLAVEARHPRGATARFDLAFELLPTATGLVARVEYDADLFDASTVARLAARFEALALAAITSPDQPLLDLPLAAPGERLADGHLHGPAVPVAEAPIRHRLAAQAAATPSATALEWADGAWTYAELDARANRLAQRLQAAGVGPETRVALRLGRGPGLPLALLAVWKAGGMAVPLDPAWPAARLSALTADAGAAITLTEAEVLDPSLAAGPADAPPADAPPAATPPAAAPSSAGPAAAITADHAAYMIFTSGSTGRPKGVVVPHRGLAHLVEAAELTYGLDATWRMAQLASPGFDAAIFEVVAILATGGTLVVARREDMLPGPPLQALIARHRLNTLHLPPSALAAMPPPDAESPIRRVIVAGEACPVALAAAWARRARVFNAYGPTEATVWATVAEYTPGDATLPIGRPIANASASVRDAAGRPLPVGVPGELWLAGPGLARGYDGRPDLTAERFVDEGAGRPDLTAERPIDAATGRWYRTGDRVRLRPDGQLAFLGRLDHQLKVRGFRLEPGEIEHALRAHPEVHDALVLARPEHAGEALTAYVVPKAAAPAPGAECAHVDRWRALYEAPQAATLAAPGDDFTGWDSALTGRPFELAEMHAWRDATVTRIRALQPRRLYEIGCGRALLASRLAPSVDAYLASDLAAPAVAAVAALHHPAIRVWRASADDFSGVPHDLDTIVLNSVVQYFPSADYLAGVLREAAAHLAPGGRIFVGDVRDLRQLPAFRAAVAAARGQAPPEVELCLDPAFFHGLGLSGLRVEVLPKAGGPAELVAFRYDVVLHVDAPTAALTAPAPTAAPSAPAPTAAPPAPAPPAPTHPVANAPLRADQDAGLGPRLRAHLADRLPAPLVPGHWVVLDAFPLTPAGKVDRAALPAPSATRAGGGAYVAPRTAAEAALAELFAEALGLDRVGVEDDFFALGGHSLLATRLVARARERLGVELPLRRLFEAPTVAGLAAALPTTPPRPPAAVPRSATPLGQGPLSPAQAMWWSLFPRRADLEHGIQNSWLAARLDGPVDADALEAALQAVIARHDALRTTFAGFARTPHRVVHAVMPVALARADAPDEATGLRQLQADAQAPFDLAAGPLLRAALYRLGPTSHLFMVSVSHLVFDGGSLRVLLAELDALYGALATGRELPALPTPLAYHDYARWQRRRLWRSVVWRELPYWLMRGRGMRPVLDLPTDKPRPAQLSMAGGSVLFTIPPAQAEALRAFARAEGVTPFMLLLAAFQVTLHRHGGMTDVYVGTPAAGRADADVAGMIGLTLNFLVLRGDLGGRPTFRQYLRRVKDVCLGALAHPELPFNLLMRAFRAYVALTTGRAFDAERAARSNVMFNLLEDFDPAFALGPVRGTLLPLESTHAAQALHLILTGGQGGLTGHLIFDADLFERETAERLARAYQALLTSVVSDPDQPVSSALA